MTNVPQDIREIWTELYKIFDRYYLMPDTPEAWKEFWWNLEAMNEKYNGNPRIGEAFVVIADTIGDRMKKEKSECL